MTRSSGKCWRERVIRAIMTSPWLILSGLGLALLLLGCGVGLYAGASFAWGGQDWFPASDPWSRMLWAGRTGVFIFGLGLLTAIAMAAALAGQTRFQRRKNRKYAEERDD